MACRSTSDISTKEFYLLWRPKEKLELPWNDKCLAASSVAPLSSFTAVPIYVDPTICQKLTTRRSFQHRWRVNQTCSGLIQRWCQKIVVVSSIQWRISCYSFDFNLSFKTDEKNFHWNRCAACNCPSHPQSHFWFWKRHKICFYFFVDHFLWWSQSWFWYLSVTNRDRGSVYCVTDLDWSRLTMMMTETFHKTNLPKIGRIVCFPSMFLIQQ